MQRLPLRPTILRPTLLRSTILLPTLCLALTTLLVALMAAPAAAQDIPDNIPDVPGESPADRAQERFVERHRGFLSRIFTTGSFDAGPLPRDGLGYQTNVSVGLDFRSGDAMFVAINSRILPDRDPQYFDNESLVVYAGVGYTLSGTRFLGSSEAGQRSALSTELGVWSGEASLVALDLSPTYAILRGASWSVPAGVRFSLARINGPDGTVVHPFVGLTIGAKLHLFARERLELR